MTSEPISKVSPDGSKTNLSFSLYYISGQYALNFYGRDYKGDPLVSLDFFENPMAHPRMKVQVLGSLKLPLAKKKFGEKSVGKHDF